MLPTHKDSHLDHALTHAQRAYVLDMFSDRSEFFIATIELPENLGTVPCGLYGPLVGDAPIAESEVTYCKRGPRAYESRMIERPSRPSRLVTVIAGPHDGLSCVVYTMFGGPLAPQEPNDPTCKDRDSSARFWSEHALAIEVRS